MSGLLDLVPGLGWLRIALRVILAPVRAVGRWLMADWRHPIMFSLALVVLAHTFIIDPARERARKDAEAGLFEEILAHKETVEGFKARAAEASRVQSANLARVGAEQAAITERIADDFKSRRAELHARAERLRRQAAAGSGLSGTVLVPGTGPAAGGADAAPGDHRFPAEGTCPPLNFEERVVASDQALQLDGLISWVEKQIQVRSNP